MNQILATENINYKTKRNKKSGQTEILSIVKFFSIMLIIFGIFIIATSSFALYKNNSENKKVIKTQPRIELEQKDSSKQIILKVMHEEIIDKVIYYWNDGERQEIDGNGRKYLEEIIDIPDGENTLNIQVYDIYGQQTSDSKIYKIENDINIEIKSSGNNIKIEANSEEEIAFIKYYWDDEDAEEREVNQTEFSTEIEALKGEHQLTVIVTDVNGNEEEKTQAVIGTTKPVLQLEPGDNCYIIKASDEVKLDRIEIKTVEDGKVTTIQTDDKEFEYNYPLKENNENRVEITAYNSNGVASNTKKAKWKK